MNIGIIHGFVGGGGGTEKTVLQIIDSLKKYHNLTLYTFSKPTVKISDIQITSKLPFKLPAFGLYQRSSEHKLLELAKHDDLIIQASGGLSVPDSPTQKIIVYCHGDFQTISSKSKYKGIWALYYKPYEKLNKKSLRKINDKNVYLISNSNYVKASIQKHFQKDSIVIYPPVNVTDFNSTNEKLFDIVTISRYSPEKNLDFALETIMKTNYNYTVIGNTKTKSNILYFDHLKTKSKNHKTISLENNIERKDLIEKLNKSKVYFHASEETFGISIIESIAAGCIPIVPNNSAHKETVPIDELRYIPDDLDDANKKIKRALSGDFDQYLPNLQQNISSYDEENFKHKIKNYVNALSN